MTIWKSPDINPENYQSIMFITKNKSTRAGVFKDGFYYDDANNQYEDDELECWATIYDVKAQADKAERLQKAVEWLVGGDTGISSKTMCAALFGATPKDSDMPHDAGDFGRCLRFIRFMPDGTKDIVFKKLSDKPEWVEIGNRWDELVELYDQENWRGIYDILSAIRKEYRQPRPNEIFIGL